jgi:hypothetical protein
LKPHRVPVPVIAPSSRARTYRWIGSRSRKLLSARFSLLASRIQPAQPLRIRRNPFSISMDYFFARSASHQTRRRFKCSIYLFTDHSVSFGSGAVATPHQLHHPQRYNAICLGCQHHQRSEHPRVGPARFETGNSVHLTATFSSAGKWVNIWAEAGRPAPQQVAHSNLRRRQEVKQVVPPSAGPFAGTW